MTRNCTATKTHHFDSRELPLQIELLTHCTRGDTLKSVTMGPNNLLSVNLFASTVQTSLDWLATEHPDRVVEVRVATYHTVQSMAGTTHRHGAPPAVVKKSP